MKNIFNLPGQIKQTALYLATSLSMIITGYFHLDFAAQGIQNIRLEDIYNAWPVVLLSISILLEVISAVVVFSNSQIAARLALIGAVFGWIYFVFFICGAVSLVSIMFVVLLKSLIMFLPQCILLYLTSTSAKMVVSK